MYLANMKMFRRLVTRSVIFPVKKESSTFLLLREVTRTMVRKELRAVDRLYPISRWMTPVYFPCAICSGIANRNIVTILKLLQNLLSLKLVRLSHYLVAFGCYIIRYSVEKHKDIMVDQMSSYRKYVRGIRGLLLFAGLWPSRKWAGTAYRFIPFINALVCFALSCAVLGFCGDQLNNLELLTKGFGIVGSYWTAVLKVSCFLINHKELMDLHRTLEKYFEKSLSIPAIREQIFAPLSIFVIPFYAITFLLFIATLAFFIAPVIIVCVQLSHDIRPLKFLLPNPGKYPYSFEGGSLLYYVHYAWQMLAATYLLCLTSGVDSLFGYYVFQMHATFQLMNHRIKSLGLADEDNGGIVRECVEMYQMLAKSRDQLQLIYGPIVFWIFLTSAIILCSQIFQASQTGQLTVGRGVLFVTYISLKLLQALMYAWYGSVIVTESERFREAVYGSEWPGSGDKELMTNVLIMMCNKPLGITACKFLVISTNMFTAIINTTMSYFFLLQTLDEAN